MAAGQRYPTQGNTYSMDDISGNAQMHLGDQHYHFGEGDGRQGAQPMLQLPTSNKLGLLFRDAPQIDSNLFIGRQFELQKMESVLRPGEHDSDQRRLVLGGMGGIGKTQIAIAYAKQHQLSYDTVFWLNASSEALLRNSIRSIASRFEQHGDVSSFDNERLLAFFAKWLSQPENTRWLLILDNYDDLDSYDIRKFLPHCSHGSIIMTTRQTNELAEKCACSKVHLLPFESLEEALGVLATRSGRGILASDQAARQLAERFHGLPLALATAGAFLRSTPLSFSQYLETYETRWVVSSKAPKPLAEYDSRTMYTTWDISFQQLMTTNPDAANILKLLAYFDNERIWHDYIKAPADCSLCDDPPLWAKEVIGDGVRFAEAMHDLVNFSLLDFNESTGLYSIHNCIHDWTLAKLNKDISPENFWFAVGCITHFSRHKGMPRSRLLERQQVAAHAVRLSQGKFMDEFVSVAPTVSRVRDLEAVTYVLTFQGQYDTSNQIIERLLSAYKNMEGFEGSDALRVAHSLGVGYANAGKYHKAQKVLQWCWEGRKSKFGEQGLDTLEATESLGTLYLQQGKYNDAEDMLRRAWEGFMSVSGLGLAHTSTLSTATQLANLYIQTGESDEAEHLLDQAHKGYGIVPAVNRRAEMLCSILLSLACVYLNTERLKDAEELSKQILNAQEQYNGHEHPKTLRAAGVLGVVYHMQGRLPEAEQHIARTVEGYTRVLGDGHLFTLMSRNNLALVFMEDPKRWTDAEELLHDSVETWKCVFSGAHAYNMINDMILLGDAHHRQGKLNAAEETFREALTFAKTIDNGYEQVVVSERWLHHLEEMRVNDGLCYHIMDADKSGLATSQESNNAECSFSRTDDKVDVLALNARLGSTTSVNAAQTSTSTIPGATEHLARRWPRLRGRSTPTKKKPRWR